MMSSSTDRKPPWVELPREITASILQKLGAVEILTVAQKVCSAWRSVCLDPSMWRSIVIGNTHHAWDDQYNMVEMCRRAVDRSQGQLVDITIYLFCCKDLLIYISERCPRLKRIRLVHCYEVNESWSKAFQNLPLLEELHLEHTPMNTNFIETIGTSCPQLKSFKLNKAFFLQIWDLDALAIAKMMPQLRHLELIGNQMTNEGLRAILDGCPHLETLDLRKCYNINFGGNIAKLCSQRIKDLRCPHDALEDCAFASGGYHHYLTDDDYMDLGSEYGDHLEFSGGSMGSYDEYYDLDEEPFFGQVNL